MKFLLVLALIVVATFSAATDKSYKECRSKIDIECDADCDKEMEKCQDLDGDVMKTDDCKDMIKESVKNISRGEDEKWSEKYGELFHGCAQECIDEISGNAKKIMEKNKACSANVLSVAVAMVAVLALLF